MTATGKNPMKTASASKRQAQPVPIGTGQNGLAFYPGYLTRAEQAAMLAALDQVFTAAPLFTPRMPKSGRPFSVRMSNCGELGWISDQSGYRYAREHPQTGKPWPPLPDALLALWHDVADYPHPPEACLINFYAPSAKMGLHQDRDEADFSAPVVSVSLGYSCLFRVGGPKRSDATRSFRLNSGDVVVLGGDARLAFHGVDRIYPGTSTLLPDGGRINLTMRRVTRPEVAGRTLALAVAKPTPSRDKPSCETVVRKTTPKQHNESAINMPSLRAPLGFGVLLAVMLCALSAHAADPIFPTGSRLGLVPPTGMVQSKTFQGFEDPDKTAAILLAALPARAYAELEKSMVPEAMQKEGIDVDKREAVTLGTNQGFILTGKQTTPQGRYRKWLLVAAAGDVTALVTVQIQDQDQTYDDNAIHDALATLAVRANVPDAEQLSLLPFNVQDLAGFRIDDVVPGNALMLTDAPVGPSAGSSAGSSAAGNGEPDPARDTHFLIAAMAGGPDEAADRDNFCPRDIRKDRRHPGCTDPGCRGAAHRRPAGLPDPGQRQGGAERCRCQSRAVAALWQRRLHANDRDCSRRSLAERIHAAAHRARQPSIRDDEFPKVRYGS